MQHRTESVLIETERYRLHGSLTLPRDGYRSRLSDFLNACERDFVALTDVTIEAFDRPGERVEQPFIAVSRQHIILALPAAG